MATACILTKIEASTVPQVLHKQPRVMASQQQAAGFDAIPQIICEHARPSDPASLRLVSKSFKAAVDSTTSSLVFYNFDFGAEIPLLGASTCEHLLPGLKSITISAYNEDEDGATELISQLAQFTNLRSAAFHFEHLCLPDEPVPELDISPLAPLPLLTSMRFSMSKRVNQQLWSLNLVFPSTLTFLDLSYIRFISLSSLQHCTALQTLFLNNTWGLKDADITLPLLTSLRRLDLIEHTSNSDAGETLSTPLSKLTYLDLTHSHVSNYSLQQLSGFKSLQHLSLVKTDRNSTVASTTMMGALRSLRSLTSLHLCSDLIDLMMDSMDAISNLTGLTALTLFLPHVASPSLSRLSKLTNLQLLDISDSGLCSTDSNCITSLVSLRELRALWVYNIELLLQPNMLPTGLTCLQLLHLPRLQQLVKNTPLAAIVQWKQYESNSDSDSV